MTVENPAYDQPDAWLVTRYTALVDDLAATLDMAAGITEAIQPSHFTSLTTELNELLDFDAGLTAIIGPPAAPGSPSDAPPTSGARHDDPQVQSWAARFAGLLRSLDAPARLRLRAHPHYVELRGGVHLVTELDDVRVRARALAVDLDRVVDLAVARELARDLVRDLARAIDLARALDHDRDRDLIRARDLARALVHDLDLALDLARDRALAGGLVRARALARDRALARGLDLARAYAHTRARALGRELWFVRLGTQSADATTLRRLQDLLNRGADDFIGADLRSASLTGAALEKIRWSTTTLWPTEWQEQIRAASVEIAPGIFEITGRGQERSDHRAQAR